MSKTEKLIARLCNLQGEFTWHDLETLMARLGYVKSEGSGSRVKFDNGDSLALINLHRPHPGNKVKNYARRQIILQLRVGGYLL